MRYVFLALLALNAVMFGYYTFLHDPSVAVSSSESVVQASSSLKNPVTATNVTSELPPMIGTK